MNQNLYTFTVLLFQTENNNQAYNTPVFYSTDGLFSIIILDYKKSFTISFCEGQLHMKHEPAVNLFRNDKTYLSLQFDWRLHTSIFRIRKRIKNIRNLFDKQKSMELFACGPRDFARLTRNRTGSLKRAGLVR